MKCKWGLGVMLGIPSWAMLMIAVACNAATKPEDRDEWSYSHIARIQGQVTDLNGQPLDSADIGVAVLSRAHGTFVSTRGVSDRTGAYVTDIRRFDDGLPPQGGLDSLDAIVRAFAIRTEYRRPDGTFPSDSAIVRLRFSRYGQEPATQRVDLRISVIR